MKYTKERRLQFGFQRPVLGRDVNQGDSHLVGGGGGDDQARSGVLVSRRGEPDSARGVTTGICPAGVAIIDEILGYRELRALCIHDQSGRWRMRVKVDVDVSIGTVVFKADGFDAEEIIAV